MRKAFLQLHLSVFLAGFTGILGKLITLNEGLLVWYRLLITSISLFILFRVQGSFKKLPWKDILPIGSTGVVVALHWLFFYGSIKYANVSIGVICFSLTSLFTAIFDPLINRRRFDVAEMLLSLLTLFGILLIFHFDSQYRTGIILGIISSMFAALFTVFNKRLIKRFDTYTITFYELSTGFVVLTVLMPLYIWYFPVASLTPGARDIIYLFILSWFCTILMYLLSMSALKKISPFTVNLCFNLEPVYSIILAFILFDESKMLNGAFYAGLGCIILSVCLQMFRVSRGHGLQAGAGH
ncbi:Threonine/homoserine efflux transporter RhtA [Chitinophaga terrae (ex Kim and Jung 2007)]|jgi:drug/metabolite transporter (DMT)-like permease|uniref:Threonine/homoserine efflux transporter RhtA n=1 Tax=Chitinophaga terrae (ex Kim and Jung 2007) TaxID=408074 RepID=A0A1H4BIP7_9BACT|nr:DMT family transporter [Chitinophaga terrae (ex Kim and Jung 2007)]MDQ0109341.1 drug/metabolite transporter (DMT)-like permease [Chitinophaga terrae (ex Kim and Jung 2007)]SEA47977.1 Threonine/homoserine efflux transporter RhtA [Chitinophaga terrae (ex Kim and Jung 2007)]